MELVYICSPLRATATYAYLQNIANAVDYCKLAIKQRSDIVPIAPHIYFTRFMNDNDSLQRSKACDMGLALLERCSELWVYGDYISNGMLAEINYAETLGLPIRYFTADGQPKGAVS